MKNPGSIELSRGVSCFTGFGQRLLYCGARRAALGPEHSDISGYNIKVELFTWITLYYAYIRLSFLCKAECSILRLVCS